MTLRQAMTVECKLLRSHRSTGRSWSEEPPGKATNKQSLRHEWECTGQEGGGSRGRGQRGGGQRPEAGESRVWANLAEEHERGGADEAADRGAVRSRRTVCQGLGGPRRQSSPKALPEAVPAPSYGDAVRLLGVFH